MNKRFLRIATAIATLSLIVAACGDGGSDEEAAAGDGPITLEMPSWQADDGNFSNWLVPLVEAFNDEHDNIEVDLQHVPFDGFTDSLTTRFAAGDPPEIVHLPSANFAEFADNDWFAPLDERLENTDILDTWTDLQDEMVWDGQYQGVLLLGYGHVLFYNQAMLDEAGVDIPTTPESMVEAAAAMTEGDNFGFVATTADHPRNYEEPTNWLIGHGLHWTEGDAFVADSPDIESALETYRELLGHAPEGVTSAQRWEMFSEGRAGMMIDGPFVLPDVESAPEEIRDDLQVARLPWEYVSGGTSNGLHIPAGLDEATEDAVWQFIEFAASPEWQERYVTELSVPAPREGVVTDEMVEAQPRLEPILEAADEAVASSDPEPVVLRANYSQFTDIIGQRMQRLWATDDPVDAILADIQEALESEFDLSQ